MLDVFVSVVEVPPSTNMAVVLFLNASSVSPVDLSRWEEQKHLRVVQVSQSVHVQISLAALHAGAWLGGPGSKTCSNGVQMEL